MTPEGTQILRLSKPISARELDGAYHAVRVLENARRAISDYVVAQKTPSSVETLRNIESLLEQSRARYQSLLQSRRT